MVARERGRVRWSRQARAAGLITAASLTALAAPVSGQSLDEARQQREATLQEKARAAEQLDVLGAREADLRAALAGLDQALAHQTARVEAAERARVEAEAQAEARAREAAATAERVAALRQRAVDAVVDAYVDAAGQGNDALLSSGDVHEVVQRRSLLHLVHGDLRDDLDRLRVLSEEQRRAEAAARRWLGQAEQVRNELTAAQGELQRQREAEARLETALRASISDWQAKADQLAQAEQQLDEVIRQRTAEAASAAAASRGGGTVSLGAASASGFTYPTDGEITSSFGWRRHPILGTSRLHAGIDFGAPTGSDVWAAKAGVVIFAGWNGGYGNCVMIEHDGGVVTLYGHMSRLFVSEGQTVSRGTVIGAVGSTGLATGPHLHFETRVGDEPEDPLLFLR